MSRYRHTIGILWMAGALGVFATSQTHASQKMDSCETPGWRMIDGYCLTFAEDTETACAPEHLKQKKQIGAYVFKSYRSEDDGSCFEVVTDQTVIFRRTSAGREGYVLGQPANKEDNIPAIEDGTDITGQGKPQMIVSLYTGGAHCCTLHYIFELEPAFKKVAVLNAMDTWPAYFSDLDGDGKHYYYIAEDWTFRYWLGSFAGSPRAPIVLRFQNDSQGGSFHLALDKMRKPAPTVQEWDDTQHRIIREIRQEKLGNVSYRSEVLWGEVMPLIYSGHSDMAWKLVRDVSARTNLPKNENLEEFCSILKTSSYWPDLKPSLKAMPASCARAKVAR